MPHATDTGTAAKQGGTFSFVSSYLRQRDAVFVRSADRQPVLRFDFGGNRATVPLATIPAAAELPDGHPDLALLQRVEPALLYRETVATGDPIPTEIVDGRPSWTVHARTAKRVERRILEALCAQSAGHGAQADGDPAETIARQLIGVDTRRNPRIVQILRDHLDAATYSMQLSDDVTACQRMVGEMATLATQREAFAEQDRIRDSALKLRHVIVWATKRTMALDMLANDIKGALADRDQLARETWPAINELRAWTLDLAPALRSWNEMGKAAADLRIGDIENLHRLITIRFGAFDPAIYRQRTAVRPPDTDAKKGVRRDDDHAE
ncbi:hypothetical protein [Thalassobaculum salexigens]|nr:hypothetical protein [Thalassobaculum salexigens]